LFLFQFERREAGFVITSYNDNPIPGGKWRFCQGLQFNSLDDARKYIEARSAIENSKNNQLSNTDSVSKRWAVEKDAEQEMDRLEKGYKCRRVGFDIPYVEGQVDRNNVYTTKEIKIIPQDGIGAKDGRLPSRIA